MCGLTSATVTPLAGKNRRGRACVVPNTGGCAEDDTILPKQHSVCGAEARATLKQSAYCAPESLDACLCLQTLGEALHPKLHCVPPGGTMDPPQTLLSHMQRRCLETARPGKMLADSVTHLQLIERIETDYAVIEMYYTKIERTDVFHTCVDGSNRKHLSEEWRT